MSSPRIRFNKDPAAAWSHFLGFLAAIWGLVFLVCTAPPGDGPKVTALAIYGASLVVLFLASSAYHFLDLGPEGNRWLRRLDHGAIFVLIAGSYAPPLLILLDGAWRISMISVVAALAIVGAVVKLAWMEAPGWVTVGIYLVLGWVVVIPGPIIFPQVPAGPLAWLIAGGLTYSAGALVFVFRWPDPWPEHFGHHEVWHLFVLFGSFFHFMFTTWLVDVPRQPFF